MSRPRPAGNSIVRKLTWLNVLVSGAALALACLAFIAYDIVSYRDAVMRNLSAEAQIIGSNSVSALVFNDAQAAQRTLSALAVSPNITAAGILTADGRLFARYVATPGTPGITIPAIPPGQSEAYWFEGNEIVLAHSIVFQGKNEGVVYLRANSQILSTRLKRYAAIAAGVLLVSLLFAILLSIRSRRVLAEPIVNLAETALAVSRDKNYSLRAPLAGDGSEMDVLVEAFNQMLAQIQQRDRALRQAQERLEERVEERTAQLRDANKELEAFSYSVSHDLRGPLEVIDGISYILLKNYGHNLDQDGKDYLERLSLTTHRMSELIEDLLDLSRVTRSVLHREKLDLSAIACSIAEELQRSEPQRRVQFKIAPGAVGEGDSRLVRLALQNLLGNAWKYTSHHEQACIEFGWEQRNGQNVFFVRDDGAGFDPRQASRLFMPFQRLHSAAEFPGTGVGLATVQRIISRHGGEIWAEGAVEQGATFYFTLAGAAAATMAS